MKLTLILLSLFALTISEIKSSSYVDSCLYTNSNNLSSSINENPYYAQSIGRWKYTGSDFPRSTFEIKIKNSEYICIVTFLDDKSSSTERLTKIGSNRFKVNKSNTGEYYKINSKNGQLEMWDQDGLFIIALKI